MPISKLMTIRVPILLILTLLLFGCGWPFGQEETNPNVEIIVPSEEVRGWGLSPGGDKIIYGSAKSEATFLLYLETKEKHNIDFCNRLNWLDNINVLCTDSNKKNFKHGLGI